MNCTESTKKIAFFMIPCFLLLTPLFASITQASVGLSSSSVVISDPLSSHWIASQNCYRDELNQSDIDYYNCWTDNAGKNLSMSMLTKSRHDFKVRTRCASKGTVV